jgi:hypothetical protein
MRSERASEVRAREVTECSGRKVYRKYYEGVFKKYTGAM